MVASVPSTRGDHHRTKKILYVHVGNRARFGAFATTEGDRIGREDAGGVFSEALARFPLAVALREDYAFSWPYCLSIAGLWRTLSTDHLGHARCPLAQRAGNAVVSGIATADHDHILAFGAD